jgi:integrase/recombinase XerD
MTAPLILKQVDWPDADRAVWAGLFVEGAILAGSGPCANWAEGSRSKRAQAYGHWLGFLAQAGGLRSQVTPTERVTPAAIGAFVETELARCKPITVYIHVNDLYVVCRAMDPGGDWAWLERIAYRLRARCDLHALKPRASIDARAIHDWALARMATVDAQERITVLQRAYEYREALMVGLLIARPVRSRAFMAIELSKHLIARQSGFALRFAPEDMKDRKAREYALPADLIAPMQRYLDHHRHALLRGGQSRFLWITRYGKPMAQDSFTKQLATLTLREFGETLRPHAFRHIAATSIATDDPANVGIIASVLGHASMQMSEKHYNRARGVDAISQLQRMTQALRKEAARHERSAGAVSRSRSPRRRVVEG